MSARVFVAGASGAIGKRLVPLLVNAGYTVSGTTRSADKAALLEAIGAHPIVVDVFDAKAFSEKLIAARPELVIDQLTDLPRGLSRLDPSLMAEALSRNTRIRKEGTRNLISAMLQSGAPRLVAQSFALVYAPGAQPHSEDDLLDVHTEGMLSTSVDAVVTLEQLVTHSAPIDGVALRYGLLYGPGTGNDAPIQGAPSVHVDAAAWAALLALDKARTGVFNIVEDGDYASNAKAREVLGWCPEFRLQPSASTSAREAHYSEA